MIRLGKIVLLGTSMGLIIDENEQDIPFDLLDCPEGLYIGANVSFDIIQSLDGLMAAGLCMLAV
jgi:hypothetical protein